MAKPLRGAIAGVEAGLKQALDAFPNSSRNLRLYIYLHASRSSASTMGQIIQLLGKFSVPLNVLPLDRPLATKLWRPLPALLYTDVPPAEYLCMCTVMPGKVPVIVPEGKKYDKSVHYDDNDALEVKAVDTGAGEFTIVIRHGTKANAGMLPGASEEENVPALLTRPDIFPENPFGASRGGKIPPYQIYMTSEGLFSVTPRKVGEAMREVMLKRLEAAGVSSPVLWDATANVGSDVIGAAMNKRFAFVSASELSPVNYAALVGNVKLFGVGDRVQTILGNSLDILDNNLGALKRSPHVVYFDPPWGGKDYKKEATVELTLGGRNIFGIVKSQSFWKNFPEVKLVVIKGPYNYDKKDMQLLGASAQEINFPESRSITFVFIDMVHLKKNFEGVLKREEHAENPSGASRGAIFGKDSRSKDSRVPEKPKAGEVSVHGDGPVSPIYYPTSPGGGWHRETDEEGKYYYWNEDTNESRLLPPGVSWLPVLDEESKKFYYFNEDTGETTWDRPAELGSQFSESSGGKVELDPLLDLVEPKKLLKVMTQ
jgi:16S rRNA G966 N2-methylase RsmD